MHLLTAYIPAATAVLKQLRVGAKTNEHKAALRLLGVLPLAGMVVTGDAMYTHRDGAAAIRRGGGDYVLLVKDNSSPPDRDLVPGNDPAFVALQQEPLTLGQNHQVERDVPRS